jgi:hypothetical protein
MRKILLSSIAALSVLSASAAHASIIETYECGATKSSPPEHVDDDPIVKIKVQIGISAGSNKIHVFDVDHYAASGKIYSRQDQYRDRSYITDDKVDSWRGFSTKVPKLIMVGRLKSDGHYIEQQFLRGKLQLITISACRAVEEESH